MEKWKNFLNSGSKNVILIKKAAVILVILLAMYGLGYGAGTFFANIGI